MNPPGSGHLHQALAKTCKVLAVSERQKKTRKLRTPSPVLPFQKLDRAAAQQSLKRILTDLIFHAALLRM